MESYSKKILEKRIKKLKNTINVCEKYNGLVSADERKEKSMKKIKNLEEAILILEKHGF